MTNINLSAQNGKKTAAKLANSRNQELKIKVPWGLTKLQEFIK
jgi:hypothetical protein